MALLKGVFNVNKKGNGLSTQSMVACAMLCAAAFVLVSISSNTMPPLIPAAPFLKYDPKDVVIAMGGLLFGSLPAMIISVVVSFLEMVTFSATGWIGFVMNVLSTWAFVLPASVIYSRKKSLPAAVVGLFSGTALMVAVMMLWNYLLTPIYTGMPREAVADLLVPAFLPFNLIKGSLNMAVTLLIYKPVVSALRAAKLMPNPATSSRKGGATAAAVLIAVFIIVSCAVALLLMNKII